ncbi:hypothetical protein KXS15_25150 [Sinorhizobium meliloti]|uniref:hypothetical protein n=1 Tax=Rhizobium meliloti TaxID=382 RepID=UPI003F143E52
MFSNPRASAREDIATTKLHVVSRGDRGKPAILFVHALGTNNRFWNEAIEGLHDEHYLPVPGLVMTSAAAF